MNEEDLRIEAVAEALYELDMDVERTLGIDYVTYGAEGMRGIARYRMQARAALAAAARFDKENS